MANLKVITTEDGSHSLYNAELNETYHSFHGAIQESKHVFIDAGLEYISEDSIKVFEVGFGTGLNGLLTAIYAEQNSKHIEMHSIEAYPVDESTISKLNYQALVDHSEAAEWFKNMHSSEWGELSQINDQFSLKKILGKLEDIHLNQEYDVIFFDAFAPSKQSEMWSLEMLKKCTDALKNNGCIVTYCAQGQLKRNLKSLGLEVETLPGPPCKKEMVRGVKLG